MSDLQSRQAAFASNRTFAQRRRRAFGIPPENDENAYGYFFVRKDDGQQHESIHQGRRASFTKERKDKDQNQLLVNLSEVTATKFIKDAEKLIKRIEKKNFVLEFEYWPPLDDQGNSIDGTTDHLGSVSTSIKDRQSIKQFNDQLLTEFKELARNKAKFFKPEDGPALTSGLNNLPSG